MSSGTRSASDRSRLRFGLGLPTSGPFAEPDNIDLYAAAGQRLKFDDLWVNDHLSFVKARMSGSPAGTLEAIKEQDPNFYESVTTAAYVAGRYPGIGVGIGGLQAPLRHPIVVAKQLATLDALSRGRLTFAPGIGGDPTDFLLLKVPFEKRGRLFDEFLAALSAIWQQGSPASFEGNTYGFTEGTFYPRPDKLDLWITGEGEVAMQRAIKWADGWFCAYPDPAEYAAKVERFRTLATEANRDPDSLDTAAIIFVCIAKSRAAALAICESSATKRFKSRERAMAVCAIGSRTEVEDQLAARHAAGLRYLELRFFSPTIAAFEEMVAETAEEVIPNLLQR
jgi:alkanesulfonate monooxygenase SsuD/methylene tetrahydromethanopterin reductase-like flavin-dependent oxidoreductase (luciferase family)